MLGVVVKQAECDLVQGGLHRADLGQYVDAVAVLVDHFLDPADLTLDANVILGPIVAVLSFVCSVGNVPLAAVLWSGGISFGGAVAFLFADLIVLPIIIAYRKYYGTTFALRITALMFVTMILAALIIDVAFGGLGLIPTGARPSRGDIFGQVHLDYKLALNILGVVIFAALMYMTIRRGVTDPVCGMKVDRAKAIRKDIAGQTYYLCSDHCLHTFETDPGQYADPKPAGSAHAPAIN